MIADQKIRIDCLIVYSSECSNCFSDYVIEVKPFIEKYQNNQTISFSIIDYALDPDSFYRNMPKFELGDLQVGGFPWVIFSWDDEKLVILDENHLNSIDFIYESIIEGRDFDYPIYENNNLLFFNINLRYFLVALLIIGAFVLILTVGFISYNSKQELQPIFNRISRERLALLSILSLVSAFILLYQVIDYFQGGCGCLANSVVEVLLFRRYDYISMFGLNIPIALLGLGFVVVSLLQTFVIGLTPIPMKINLPFFGLFNLTLRKIRLLYYLLILEFVSMLILIFYLIYVELVILNFICLLCTISQITILLNTILIINWRPFSCKNSM